MKKKNILIILLFLVLLFLVLLLGFILVNNNKKEKELQDYQNKLDMIRNSYNKYVNVTNANIYILEKEKMVIT